MVIVLGNRGGTAVRHRPRAAAGKRDEGNTVTIYPKASSTPAADTEQTGVRPVRA